MDISLVISLVALVLSVVSPVIAAAITGGFQIWQKHIEVKACKEKREQEFYQQHRAEVIERYIEAVGRVCKNETVAHLNDFGGALGEIYLYVDESHWELLDQISAKLNKHSPSDPTKEFIELCKILSKEDVRPH